MLWKGIQGHSFVTEGISPIGTGEKRKARKAMGKAKSDGDGSKRWGRFFL